METEKDKLEKMENLYNMVVRFQQKSHEKNQKRIKIGLRCLYIIPAVFLFLLLVTDSSKIIFLVLWIVSLFALAIYLITVEYMDYNLQNQMNKLEGRKNAPVDGLIEMDRFNESGRQAGIDRGQGDKLSQGTASPGGTGGKAAGRSGGKR